jgi:hypothetical protein
LHRAHCGLGVQDRTGKLVAAALVIGGLVPDQARTTWTMTMLDVDRPTGRSTVGNVTPAIRTHPGQR